jgi:hypothetical protein
VTTVQEPQHRTTTQGPSRRYPIALQLRYQATAKHGPLYGFGQTRMMSSKDIIFAPGDGLKPGMTAEIAVAWPRLLDGRIRLQLVLEASITSSQDGVVEARILTYDFRTRRPVEQITEPAGAVGPPPVDCVIRNSPELK